MSEVEIEWPWQYSFPPFFTLQPHPETRAKQVAAWKNLILEYCQKNKLYIIDVREAHQLPLFHNSSINRQLDPSVITSILSELAKTGNAAPLDKTKHRWEIYWHTLEEWASMIYEFVCESGMQNSVLTLFELSQGDDVQDRAFAEISSVVALAVVMEVDFLDRILRLYEQKDWRKVMELNKTDNEEVARRLLWVWPSEKNLQLITNTVKELGLSGIISIGCGCGLFEWLLQEYSGLPVVGYEINKEWWTSKYCNPQFIELNFPELPPTRDLLSPRCALLFCYFNNGTAFRQYVDCYGGELVFIVGPGEGAGRHTDPAPFAPDFGSPEWVLLRAQEVRDTKDFIAAYVRNRQM